MLRAPHRSLPQSSIPLGGLLGAALLVGSVSLACDGDKSGDPPAPTAEAKGTAAEEAKGTAAEEVKEAEVGAFAEYQRRSMKSEAVVQLAMLRDGVRAYAMEERVDPGTLTVATGTLPPSAPLTPAAGTCCKQPKGQCPAGSVDWSHEGFVALNFAPEQPHRYSYEVQVKGQTVTVRAVGDLDCDGTFSTLESVGTLAGDEVTFGKKLIEHDPLE